MGILEDNLDITNLLYPQSSGTISEARALGNCYFDYQDIQKLSQARAMLNDTCLNGCAAVLKYILDQDPSISHNSRRCALFTSHDLVRVQYNAKDQEFWRFMAPSAYWEKDVWILGYGGRFAD